jgi:hypothetical protein
MVLLLTRLSGDGMHYMEANHTLEEKKGGVKVRLYENDGSKFQRTVCVCWEKELIKVCSSLHLLSILSHCGPPICQANVYFKATSSFRLIILKLH